jgi:polyhydroxyalkanoate synthesis regulator phasin
MIYIIKQANHKQRILAMAVLINTIKTTLATTKATATQTVTAVFGLYGTVVDETQKTSTKAAELFNTLVERGTKIQPQAIEKVTNLVSLTSIEAKAKTKREEITTRLTGSNGQQHTELEEKIDLLTQMVNELNAESAPKTKKRVKKTTTAEAVTEA